VTFCEVSECYALRFMFGMNIVTGRQSRRDSFKIFLYSIIQTWRHCELLDSDILVHIIQYFTTNIFKNIVFRWY
jgi:hypothetical protein